jgi:hypothetical protein
MDGELVVDNAVAPPAENPAVELTSSEYLGRWNRLVSTTNWEKGRILCEWRAALAEAGAEPASYTDEAWSRRVGNVTPQHTGRLRRVYQRFGQVRQQYAALFWSHFQVALDWHDAEMWLEGAVQNDWSVAQMQSRRAATLGELEGTPADQEFLAADMDDDAPSEASAALPDAISPTTAEVHATDDEAGAARARELPETGDDEFSEAFDADAPVAPEPVRPFEDVPPLPPDLSDAFEALKLAIVHHRLCGWQEVACDDVLMALNALKQLALAPAGE